VADWLRIEGYDGYSVSIDGDVRNDSTGDVLSRFRGADGFMRVKIDGRPVMLHRMLWRSFRCALRRSDTLRFLNGDRSDVRLSNLELSGKHSGRKSRSGEKVDGTAAAIDRMLGMSWGEMCEKYDASFHTLKVKVSRAPTDGMLRWMVGRMLLDCAVLEARIGRTMYAVQLARVRMLGAHVDARVSVLAKRVAYAFV